MDNVTALERGRALLYHQAEANRTNEGLSLYNKGTWGRTHVSIVGRNRDSGTLERSNWEVVSASMLSAYGDVVSLHVPGCTSVSCQCTPDVSIESFRHFALGWVEVLCVRVETSSGYATDALVDGLEWMDALAKYPVADEEHYSQLEYDEIYDYAMTEIGSWSYPWVDEVVKIAIWEHEATSGDCGSAIDAAIRSVYNLRASKALALYLEWDRCRHLGEGQMDMDGNLIRVPEDPTYMARFLTQSLPPTIEHLVGDSALYQQLAHVTMHISQEASS